MDTSRPQSVAFVIRGPITRADLPGLCERVCALLGGTDVEVALCDVASVEPDAVTVDALARLQLAARRHGCQVRLRHASKELLELVGFMGLSDVCSADRTTDEFSGRAPSHVVNGLRNTRRDTMTGNGSRKMFVNLAVEDLGRSVAFFTKLGFSFDPQFTDEQATCMIVSDDAFVMLLVESRFKDFTKKDLADPSTQTEAIFALSAESREQVDEMVDKALEAGGAPSSDPVDMGFMYERSFQDLDGHIWGFIWMDPSAAVAQ